jgi:hypothetical protein
MIAIMSVSASFVFNMTADPSLQIQDPQWRNDWMVKVLYGNKDSVKGEWSWVQVSMCIFITVAALKTVFGLKNQGRKLYKKYSRSGLLKHDFEWLKSRTIHVRGLLKNDVNGVLLENVLNEHLQNTESKILGIIIVPDYKKLVELEEKRKDYEDLSHLLGVKAPTCMRLLIREKHRNEEHYQLKLEEIEKKMQDILLKPNSSSGHAYVVFDSYYSMSK